MYKQILVPTDGSELSDQAVDHGIKLAKALGARLSVILVMTPFPAFLYNPGFVTIPDNYEDDLAAYADEALARAKSAAAAAGVECNTLPVLHEQPYEAIIAAANKENCDLIVMASHGRRGLSAVLLGSETLKVLTHSKRPVLVYRPKV